MTEHFLQTLRKLLYALNLTQYILSIKKPGGYDDISTLIARLNQSL